MDEEAAAALRQRFLDAMGNDLNTAMGITLLYDVLKANTNDATKRAMLAEFDGVLSLGLLEAAEKAGKAQEEDAAALEGDGEILALIEERQQARKAKDFARADAIRDRLAAMGVVLKDTPAGVTFTREKK